MGLQMRVLKQMSNEGLQPSPTARCISPARQMDWVDALFRSRHDLEVLVQTSISDLIIWLRWRPNASRMHPIFTFKEDQRQTPAFGNQISPRFRQHRAAVSALGDKPSAAIQIQANSLNFQGVEKWANRGGAELDSALSGHGARIHLCPCIATWIA